MGIRAGLLREVIRFIEPVVTRNDFGEEQTTWQDVATTRARVEFRSGTRTVEVNEVFNPYTVLFDIRRFLHVTPQMRIVWRGSQYIIDSINNEPHRQRQVVIAQVVNE